MERRNFILSSSAALATIIAGCRKPEHKLISGILPNEENPSGEKIYYNTVFPQLNVPYTISVKTIDSRPIKIDGNDISMFNKKGTNALIQASLFSLYDPARFNYPKIENKVTDIETAIKKLTEKISTYPVDKKINILYSNDTSAGIQKLISLISQKYSNVSFTNLNIHCEPEQPLAIIKEILKPVDDNKPLIISLGYDFLAGSVYSLFYQSMMYSKDRNGKKVRNAEILVAEPGLSLTGLNANFRETKGLNELNILKNEIRKSLYAGDGGTKDSHTRTESKILNHLQKNRIGRDIILLTADYLDNDVSFELFSKDGKYYRNNDHKKSFSQFIDSLNNPTDDLFIFLDCNAYYGGSHDVRNTLKRIPNDNIISLSLYNDEMSSLAANYIPSAHYLETWDLHQYPGDDNYLIQQPVVSKLNKQSISSGDFLLKLFGITGYDSYYDLIKDIKRTDEDTWINNVRAGLIRSGADEHNKSGINTQLPININRFSEKSIDSKELHLIKVKNPYLLDNIETNNPYLHELPHPVTKQYYGNAAVINNKTASKLSLNQGILIKISSKNGSIILPVIILDGITDNLIVTEQNFGHKINLSLNQSKYSSNSHIFGNHGSNVDDLFNQNEYYQAIPVSVDIIDDTGYQLLTSGQIQHIKLDKDINKFTAIELQNKKKETKQSVSTSRNFNKSIKYLKEKWEMAIDLSACSGCNSCVVACNIENNIPITGTENISNNRDMAWLKVNTYLYDYQGDTYGEFMPVMCQHCENAPCEPVCPVHASTHSPSGLNEMVYNRCVGSRYCMVNCPYEVRTFNFENYNPEQNSLLNLMLNPDVTVRGRGVSEKCSFCVQRINESKSLVNRSGQASLPTTACQDVCPVNAIDFGNVIDKSSEINHIIINNINNLSKLLDELGTKPSVHYINRYPVG